MTTTTTIPTLDWSYLSLVYADDSDDEIELYVNGLYVTSSTNGVGSPATDSNNLLIGGSTKFDGSIDDFRIYDYARSASQIKADFNSLSVSSSSASFQGRKNDLMDGLVGWWKMDESTWTVNQADVIDYSGLNNNEVVKGTGDDPVAGKYYRAGKFNGSTDYVNMGNVLNMGTDDWSISLWVNPTTLTGRDTLVAKAGADSLPGYQLYLESNKLRVRYQTSAGGGVIGSGAGNITTGSWYFLTVTFDRDGSLKKYINGILHESNDISMYNADLTTSDELHFGDLPGFSGSYNFDGQIDDVRIYNKARSADQIRRDYETGPPSVSHWKMDDNVSGAGQTIKDNTGTNNGTTYGSNIDCTKDGKYGKGCKFDGSSDYVGVASSDSLNPDYIPVEVNVYAHSWSGRRVIINKPFNTHSYPFYQYYLYKELTGKLTFWIVTTTGTIIADVSNPLSTNRWYHLAATYDGTWARIYVDGVQVAVNSGTPGVLNKYNTNLNFGRFVNLSQDWFDGILDNVKIYNYVRTPKQIQNDMLGRED